LSFNQGFVGHADELLAWSTNAVIWDERLRSRKTASFGVAYRYSQMEYAALPMPPELDAVASQVALALGFQPNNCLLNSYANGAASMGFHSDDLTQLTPATGVAIISLGCTRSIVYRLKSDRNVEARYALAHGSLLYMSDDVQQDWLHAVPADDTTDERISLTFRRLVTRAGIQDL
jgi:alkylated DNA repair dioxygenase AlkB